jgi:hypothetical protein
VGLPKCLGVAVTASACAAESMQAGAVLQRVDQAPMDWPNNVPSNISEGEMQRTKQLNRPTTVYSNTKVDGVLVRQPVMGKFLVCRGEPSVDCRTTEALNEGATELIPQIGQLRLLPLVNHAFQKNGIAVEVAKDGRLVSFSYKNERAIAAALAASANDAAKQFKDYKDSRATAQKTANDAKIADLKYQIDLYEQTKKRDDLGKPDAAKSPAEIKAEQDAQNNIYAKAELTLLLTNQCLDRARANPTTPQICPAE